MNFHKYEQLGLIGIIKTGNKERNSNNSVAITMREKNMKIIEKIIRVEKDLEGEVWVNGLAKFDHSMSVSRVFIDSKKALDFADLEDEDHNVDEFREDFENDLRHADCDAEVESSDATINEYSIDESPNWMIEELLEDYPHYEVKEMKYEIDGVVSVKKVLVEKELEVA
jgi:hypothetical protein